MIRSRKKRIQELVDNLWETQDGEIVEIVAMEDGHLVNSVRMLHRKIDPNLGLKPSEMVDWLVKRYPCYETMMREIIRRELTDEIAW